MLITGSVKAILDFSIVGERVKPVKFGNSGSLITDDAIEGAKQRYMRSIAQAMATFSRIKTLVASRMISITTKRRFVKCYMWFIYCMHAKHGHGKGMTGIE